MSEKLKEGDIVELKSGGPSMTVDSIGVNSRRVTCIYFANSTEFKKVDIQEESLKKIN